MGELIKKLYINHNNTYEIIDYLNNIIKDLDVEIEFENKNTQRVVLVSRKEEKRDRELLKCSQFKDIDKILIIIRPEYNSHILGINDKFSFYSLKELNEFEIDFSCRLIEKYNELILKNKINGVNRKEKMNEKKEYVELTKEIEDKFNNISNTEKETLVKCRIGQGVLKRKLLKKNHECKICSMSDKSFLIASHIKPWSEADNNERLDENNAFLLCPNHDALFDKGYISFDDDGKILISQKLSDKTRDLLNINDSIVIYLTNENKVYLKWHRSNKFKHK
ncbi:hypothetical protein FDB29_12365 [Clostridium botulinum]|nr:hypothetical protein [Clostridium botulinum]